MNAQRIALYMAAELEASRLEVVLHDDGSGRRRTAISENPRWYQKLCARYTNVRRGYRRLKTYIKRRETIAALYRMAKGQPAGVYAERLKPLLREVDRDWRAEGLKYA